MEARHCLCTYQHSDALNAESKLHAHSPQGEAVPREKQCGMSPANMLTFAALAAIARAACLASFALAILAADFDFITAVASLKW